MSDRTHFQRPFAGEVRPLRRNWVEEREDRGPYRNTQAGGGMVASVRVFSTPTRYGARQIAARDRVARRVKPGRSTTARGMSSAIVRHPRQRWKLARLSAPMTQTNFTPGQRRTTNRRVSTVYRAP